MRWIGVGWLVLGAMLVSVRPASGQGTESCLMCHGEASFFRNNPDSATLVVRPATLEGSVHQEVGLPCSGCHPGMTAFPHPAGTRPADCAACHAGVSVQFARSPHGYALERGNPRAPTCQSCHGAHRVLRASDPRSSTHRVRLPQTCAQCHGASSLWENEVKLPQSFAVYTQSVHGRGTERGLAAAASCADCHGVHDLLGPLDPESPINRRNVSATCGKCHPDVQLRYDASIHGQALQAGVRDSPTCTDCHGEHHILSPHDPDAPTHAARIATETCGSCHDDPLIIAKYNIEGGVVGSYRDSYHGWATRRQYERAATCTSCHGVHLVLPQGDTASTISAVNVVATCQTCHPNADATFAASYTHASASLARNPINRVIRGIYLWLIAVVIGGMVVHNAVILAFHLRKRRRAMHAGASVLRLDRSELWQHLLLTLTFVTLVVTGFALRFPEAWWVRGLQGLGMTEPVRLNTHRVAAVGLLLASCWHLYYVLLTARGKRALRAMWPTWSDVGEFLANLRYHATGRGAKPRFGRYDYTQKAEYWALIWGTLVMALTGVILWFPAAATRLLPAVTIPAAQTIHYYEAWLATLAILVWHFFFVIFHPDEYPMSWTWITGRMSRRHAEEHHARWVEELDDREGAAPAPGLASEMKGDEAALTR